MPCYLRTAGYWYRQSLRIVWYFHVPKKMDIYILSLTLIFAVFCKIHCSEQVSCLFLESPGQFLAPKAIFS